MYFSSLRLLLLLVLTVTHKQMYTSLFSFVHIDINSFFFFFPQTDKEEKNDPYFEYERNRYITVLF